ncbi:hypothetical protein GFS31_14000 [Leptolyngbya sp. BL0902]|nr:hypothetical protein GFS31_14000 [Leptolyngbya sp. BL0902]
MCQSCGSELLLQGRYRVMRLISSQSGFGRIYEAYERNVPKILKVLKESYSHNEKVLELFRREGQVLGQLNHPGVPQVDADGYFQYFPKGSPDPCHCLVMEKIDGPNLRQWMVQQGNHPINEQQAMLWLTQLTDVLHLVHQHHYFHRDIKPENIMLRSSGQLVLVDFGAAREMTQTYMGHLGDSNITAVSSAGYTPPEQEQGQGVPQSDFYAMGRTLIYLLTAKLPNDLTIYDPRSNAFQWREHAPHISSALADFVDELIAPAAAHRPATTDAILERLGQIRAAQSSRLPPPCLPSGQGGNSWPQTTLNATEPETQVEPAPSRFPRWLGGRPWLVAGLAGLILSLPLTWYAFRRGEGVTAPGAINQPDLTPVTVTPTLALAGHTGDVYDLLLLRDGITLITASADETIRFWDLEAGTLVKTLDQPTNVVKALAITTDQTVLISTGDDRALRFWALPEGDPLGQINNAHNIPTTAVEVSNNNRWLASADGDGTIQLWPLITVDGRLNLAAMAEAGPSHRFQAQGTINDLLFSRDNRWLVSGGASLHLWDLSSLGAGAEVPAPITLEGHTSFVNRLAISDDNQTLMTASADTTVRLWNLTTQTPQAVLEGHQSYVNTLRAHGSRLWSADANNVILVWDLQQQVPVGQINGFATDIWRFAVRPNGHIVTIGGSQPLIRVWQGAEAVAP